jgi:hypothetical protein
MNNFVSLLCLVLVYFQIKVLTVSFGYLGRWRCRSRSHSPRIPAGLGAGISMRWYNSLCPLFPSVVPDPFSGLVILSIT